MEKVIVAKNVSIDYIVGDFKDIGLKEYVMRKIKNNYKVKKFLAVNDVSFEINKGEMIGIIGVNGAGKSTLLKVISNIMEPVKGSIEVKGNVAALLELGSGFDGDLTVKENTYLRGAMLGYTREFMDSKYSEIIEFSGLKEFEDYSFRQLSSGMQSRLAFSIASLVDPDILILDEVLSVGDGSFQKKSADKMKEIISRGVTTLFVSHSIEQVEKLCSKVLWLHKGKQVFFGDVKVGCLKYREFLENKINEEELFNINWNDIVCILSNEYETGVDNGMSEDETNNEYETGVDNGMSEDDTHSKNIETISVNNKNYKNKNITFPIHINYEVREKIKREFGINFHNDFMLYDYANFEIEAPARMSMHFENTLPFKLGAFTYTGGPVFSNISIGRYCSIAEGLQCGKTTHPINWLSSSPFQYVRNEEGFEDYLGYNLENNLQFDVNKHTMVGNDVWIGLNVFLKDGISIGDGSIIGAGSVVTKDVPPYAIVAGNPAKIIRYRFDSETIMKLMELKWWEYKFTDFKGVDFSNIQNAINKLNELINVKKIEKYEPKLLTLESLLNII